MLRLGTHAVAFLWALLFSLGTALGQTYPNRPITLIHSFQPGDIADIFIRTLEPKIAAELGQALVIEYRPGAGGNIGAAAIAKAPPDGYLIGIATSGVLAINPHIHRNMGFDPQRVLAPVTLMAMTPLVLVASPTAPVKSVAEIIALAKSSPDKLSIGHPGNGTAHHITAALFLQKAGVQIPLVAYRGIAPVINDLLGGHIPIAVASIPATLEHIRDGRLKALAVSASKRVAVLPDVPTLAEEGLKDYQSVGWFGLVAPAATPTEVIAKLNGAFVKAMREPALREKLLALGAETSPSTPAEFREFISSESAKWAKVVAAAGIKSE
jgi:tripartite-type tricarboxylate transporter receptor subunit TctC